MAEQHTGGMIALLPADPSALVVDGGDPVEELHLTLAYLGPDMSILSDEHRAALHEMVREISDPPPPREDQPDYQARGPAHGTIWAHATFNPGPDGAVVYLVKDTDRGEDEPVAPNRQWLQGIADRASYGARSILGVLMADQYYPWQAHVTAGWVRQGLDPSKLSATGPVVFDRIRLALAGEVTDYPLIGATVEQKAQSPDPRARRLAKWWARDPKGRARWNPGTPGDYNRLRAALRKEIGPDMPQRVLDGLAANIHKMATGEWPGPKAHGGKKAAVTASEETKVVAHMDDDELMAKLDQYEAMGDNLTVGEPESVEEVYEQAVENDKDLTLQPEGTLEQEGAETPILSDTDAEEGGERDDLDGADLADELAQLFAVVASERDAR